VIHPFIFSQASCPKHEGRSHGEEYEVKETRTGKDEFEDLMDDLLGNGKSAKHHGAGYGSSSGGSDRYTDQDDMRKPDTFHHGEGEKRFGSAKTRERVFDWNSGGSDLVASHRTHVLDSAGVERGYLRKGDHSDRFEGTVHKGKGNEGRKSKDYAGHGFGRWADEGDSGFGPFARKVKPPNGAEGGRKLGSDHRKHLQIWEDKESNGESIGHGKNGDRFSKFRKGDNDQESPKEHIPNPRADLFPDTGYFGGGSSRHLSHEAIEGRKKIKAYFGKKEMKSAKDKDKSKGSKPGQTSTKAPDVKGKMHASGSKAKKKDHGQEGKGSHDAGHPQKPAHRPDANLSIQSLSGQTQGVTEVKKGAVRNFKMALVAKKTLNATKKGKSGSSDKKEKGGKKKVVKTKVPTTTTKKP
jgi:hypothetical protein